MKNIAIGFLAATGAMVTAFCLSTSAQPQPAKKSSDLRLIAELKAYPKLAYRFVNKGKFPATVAIMSCSKDQNWHTDNPAVKVVWPGFSGCDKNFCSPQRIEKKGSLTGELQIQFLAGAKTNGLFRLHFEGCKINTPRKQENVIDELWSEPIRMVLK